MASAHEPGRSLGPAARALANEHVASGRRGDRRGFDPLVLRVAGKLHGAYRALADPEDPAAEESRAAEWLLDNEYVVRGAVEVVRRVLTRPFYRDLPKLLTPAETSTPRVLALGRGLIRDSDLQLTIEDHKRFLLEYQEVQPLTIGELWALPAVLRLVILEGLAEVVEATFGPDAVDDGSPRWSEIANHIRALRLIDSQDWRDFFEEVSLVEAVLRRDPSGHYSRMDFESRDRYRKAVEQMARWGRLEELDVAEAADRRCREAEGPPDAPERHVGFYLVGTGKAEFEASLGVRPRGRLARQRWIRGHAGALFFMANATIAAPLYAAMVIAMGRAVGTPGVLLAVTVGWVPALTVAGSLVNWLVSHVLDPEPLAKLELGKTVPPELSTIVAVPTLLVDESSVVELLDHLEVLRRSAAIDGLRFVLLTDLHDAPHEHMPSDDSLLQQIRQGVQTLNEQHDSDGFAPFGLLHRARRFNEAEGCWMGWERKRGKLHELNRLLLGDGEGRFPVVEGCARNLEDVRFVITLDADTRLPRGAAERMIGSLGHPLNRPRLDEEGRVTAGYTVLQPRMETLPGPAGPTWFGRLAGSASGLDLYSHAISDVYQDLFGEGVYAGKGIYDVAAFEATLHGRVPENALLSHDLFEGVHGRAGLLSDTTLLEEIPSHVLAYTRRLHRWIRGDWQIAPWLLPRVPTAKGHERNRLSAVARWKIFDNLRRSLLAPSLVTLLVGGWVLRIGSPWIWVLVAAGVLGFPAFLGAATATRQAVRHARVGRETGPRRPTRGARVSLAANTARWLLAIVLLAFEAVVSAGAISRTLWRLLVTRKHLLQWTSAADTTRELQSNGGASLYRRRLGEAPALAASVAAVLLVGGVASAASWVLLAVWALSPQVAYWISRPTRPRHPPLSDKSERFLRQLALRTWLFFEHLVTADDHWLPPDNWQEDRDPQLARRTSPTNIGMLFTAMVAAYDLGYLSTSSLEAMVRHSLGATERLQTFRGHPLNWYSTEDLSPLEPRYVSSVDSGNLAVSLLLLRRALEGAARAPLLREADGRGLADMFSGLDAVIGKLPPVPGTKSKLHRLLRDCARTCLAMPTDSTGRHRALLELETRIFPDLDELLAIVAEAPAIGAREVARIRDRVGQCHRTVGSRRSELEMFMPWLSVLVEAPPELDASPPSSALGRARTALAIALAEAPDPASTPDWVERARESCEVLRSAIDESSVTPAVASRLLDWCGVLENRLGTARRNAERLVEDLDELADRAASMATEMDFDFLFDHTRQLLHVGYNLSEDELDPHYYDLLASEARLASYVAIAKGDLPASHWLHLGRTYTLSGRSPVLLSWGATMFEYLLPTVFLPTPGGSLLAHSCQQAVKGQIDYGRRHGTPWGVSESAYARTSEESSYRYRAFGAPGFGLRRDVGDRLVVAPYASALALRFEPKAAVRNLERLAAEGLEGDMGLYEAVDYGVATAGPLGRRTVVRAFMAHHQGMILAAIDNVLNDDVLVGRLRGEPSLTAIEYLLHERLPWRVPLQRSWRSDRTGADQLSPTTDVSSDRIRAWTPVGDDTVPQVHALTNGSYRSVITARGGGGSQRKGLALTRWRPDPTRELHGAWIYLQDVESGAVWSATTSPCGDQTPDPSVHFWPHMVEFHQRQHQISSRLRVTVAPDDDVEIRHITIFNEGDRARRVAVVTYAEMVLSRQEDDARHPAYSELFLEGQHLEEEDCLLYRRRPRAEEERPLFWAHALVSDSKRARSAGWELDRERFLGRGGSVRSPAALADGDLHLDEEAGGSVHPVAVSRVELELAPHGVQEVIAVAAASDDRAGVLALVNQYRSPERAAWAFERAHHVTEMELQAQRLTSGDVAEFAQLVSAALHPTHELRAPVEVRADRAGPQSGLWRFGVSGDLPIVLLRIQSTEAMDIARRLFAAHAFWRGRGFEIDLVILDLASGGYAQPMRDILRSEIERRDGADWLDRPGGIHLVSSETGQSGESLALEAAAAVLLDSNRGSLAEQLSLIERSPGPMPEFVPVPTAPLHPEATRPLARPEDLLFDNGLGGFSPDGREYVIHLEPGETTPAPWANVIAQPEFGSICTEGGLGYTWHENSGENRLTPWRGDPVSDDPAEILYLRDEETAEVWTPSPRPAGSGTAYQIRHGAGYTVYRNNSHGLEQRMRVFCDPGEPVKLVHIRLTNLWRRTRRITATYYVEWVLGSDRNDSFSHILTEYDPVSSAILARNPFSESFGRRVAFLASSGAPHGLTADRREFLGRDGSYDRPDALRRIGLSGRVEETTDPCAAYQVHLDIEPGETRELHFVLGQGPSRKAATRLARSFSRPAAAERAWTRLLRFWDTRLERVQVQTPDPAFDLMLNRWLPYQVRASRLWGRTGLYQSSGAFGYRDQLQDVLALLDSEPRLARDHILLAARHQFTHGDVLHWWHPGRESGVRTRCSDDLVWLPYATACYVERTGDESILDEREPFLSADPLAEGEHDRYGVFERTEESEPLYEHCLRALERAATAGVHGLPLIGTGDWNDGLDRVGVGGRGESVWLGWFLIATMQAFASVCERRGDAASGGELRRRAARYTRQIEEHAWDGEWYRRAYYDDGTPLGSAGNREARIDAVSQAWAVISGAGGDARQRSAMNAVHRLLTDEERRLVLLLDPPFDRTAHDPGYIKGYPPGIRENGAQYSHAAVWVGWAHALLGDTDRAAEVFRLVSPVLRGGEEASLQTYRVEPYAVAADIYSSPSLSGRGGWTWYTGSAAWLYRFGLEVILGIEREGSDIRVSPRIPDTWDRYTVRLKIGRRVRRISVERDPETGELMVSIDGAPVIAKPSLPSVTTSRASGTSK